MKKLFSLVFASLLVCSVVRAEVVMTDGTLAVYNPLETYVPAGTLGPDIFSIGWTYTSPTFSNIIELQMPPDLIGQMLWAVTAGKDATGLTYNGGSLLAGESVSVIMGGELFATASNPISQWFSMAAFDMPSPIAFGPNIPNGPISFPGVEDPGSGGGGIANPVPEPSTWALLLFGLGLVGFLAKPQRSTLA